MSRDSDQIHLLRSTSTSGSTVLDVSGDDDGDFDSHVATTSASSGFTPSFKGLVIKHFDRVLSGHRHAGFSRLDKENSIGRNSNGLDHHNSRRRRHDPGDGDISSESDVLGESAPPEWVLLLLGCFLGLATGLCVVAFNKGVHIIHEYTWAGTPTEGASWLRIQRLADTWHRVLLVPVTGGVIVGVMHGLVEILDQIRQMSSSQRQGVDLVAAVFPTIKGIQAAVTLGTGCSLGPEGPSVDIGKSCANGFSIMMENNKQRKIALVAAGAASGISSGFNAAVAGCFFAIETVLRPLQAENSPPFTTAMIILASVISSTVSKVLLGAQLAFTVPSYDLKSAAELPLYLILGMLCGVVSVVFARLVAWFTKAFGFIKERYSLPAVVCPALGGLGTGIIALKYPGVLYWGFTNVEEILRTGKTATAPGIWLLTQLAAAKVVATALCKGSGLVGGLYAPSLMIGAAVGAVFGGSAAELINSAIPGDAAVAQPQAYALVGMAATLASMCSVPLTSVLLLFELTKDYRIILPLMGAVGLAIWVPSVTNQSSNGENSNARTMSRGYSSLSNAEDKNEILWQRIADGDDLELAVVENNDDRETIIQDLVLDNLKVSRAMSKNFLKVSATSTLEEVINLMHDSKEKCVVVLDKDDILEGILTLGDVKRLSQKSGNASDGSDSTIIDVNTCLVSSVCTKGITYKGQTRGLLTCYPETDLAIAKELMEAKGINQLPVVKRYSCSQRESKRTVVALLYYDSIWSCLREELTRGRSFLQQRIENNTKAVGASGH